MSDKTLLKFSAAFSN